MDELILTHEMIEEEIGDFETRIQAARDKLAVLPATSATYKERKRFNDKRRALQNEIQHVKQLIGYGEDALKEISG